MPLSTIARQGPSPSPQVLRLGRAVSGVDHAAQDALKVIAHELLQGLKANVSIDWAHRDRARARLRVLVKRILRKYGGADSVRGCGGVSQNGGHGKIAAKQNCRHHPAFRSVDGTSPVIPSSRFGYDGMDGGSSMHITEKPFIISDVWRRN